MSENLLYEQLYWQGDLQLQIQRMAGQLYQKWVKKNWLSFIKSKIAGQKLLELTAIVSNANTIKQQYVGVREIPLEKIKGSEGRINDFDADFRPVKPNGETATRWKSIAQAELKGETLPAIELIQVGEVYFVRDGHHRISVAKALGRATIDAAVTIWHFSDCVIEIYAL